MQIKLTDIGKRYNFEWIFRHIDYEFTTGNNYVITGANGSGKSTLLQLIAGATLSSEGKISHVDNNNHVLKEEEIYQKLSIAAPYLDLFEDFTLNEAIDFHKKLKPFFKNIHPIEFIEILQLEKASNRQLKFFSSGMKQRVKLGLAILSDTPLLLLDEPTSNLDKKSIEWYQQLINSYSSDRLIIVCSNQQEAEYIFCNKLLNIEAYK